MKYIITIFTLMTLSLSAQAKGGGGWHWGLGLGIHNASQTDMNDLIKASNNRSSAGLGTLGTAYDFSSFIGYRIKSSSFAWQVRGGYMTQSESGNSHEYSVNGITFMPILRFIMLESQMFKLYSQFGVGFAIVSGKIKEATGSLTYSGTDQGYMGGIGMEMCFTKSHCMHLEGDLRIMGIDRVTTSDDSTFASDSVAIDGDEVEYNSRDLSVTLSGFQGLIGYTMYF